MAVHVVTVGVSVLTNAHRTGVLAVQPQDEAGIERVRQNHAERQAIVEWVKSDPWGPLLN